MSYSSDGVLTEFTDTTGRHTRYDGLNNLNQVTDPARNATSYGINIADCGCSASDNLVLSNVYHAYVDLGVTAGFVDQKYASPDYWDYSHLVY